MGGFNVLSRFNQPPQNPMMQTPSPGVGFSAPYGPIPSHAVGDFDNALQQVPPNPATQNLGFDQMDLREQFPQQWDPTMNYLNALMRIRSAPRY